MLIDTEAPNFDDLWHSLNKKIIETSKTGDLLKMFNLGKMFKLGDDYWDLDEVYRIYFENMPNYPPVELLEDSSQNSVYRELRSRIFHTQIFKKSPLFPVLNDYIDELYTNILNNNYPIIPNKKILEFNSREAKIVLEILISAQLLAVDNIDDFLLLAVLGQINPEGKN